MNLPKIRIECETRADGVIGSTDLNVIRVEQNDDGSFTAVTDHWPKPPLTKPKINTDERLFDLVRHMRAELHEADLITDKEYTWLCAEAAMANSPHGGSPSPRRLEAYDDLRKENKELRTMLAIAVTGMKNLYHDDGELQDSSAQPTIDWKRDKVEVIQQKLKERAINAL